MRDSAERVRPLRDEAEQAIDSQGRVKKLIAGSTSGDEIGDLVGPSTEIVDLHGRMLIPGFQDAHVHPVWGGLDMLRCDLAELATAPTDTQMAAKVQDPESVTRSLREGRSGIRGVPDAAAGCSLPNTAAIVTPAGGTDANFDAGDDADTAGQEGQRPFAPRRRHSPAAIRAQQRSAFFAT